MEGERRLRQVVDDVPDNRRDMACLVRCRYLDPIAFLVRESDHLLKTAVADGSGIDGAFNIDDNRDTGHVRNRSPHGHAGLIGGGISGWRRDGKGRLFFVVDYGSQDGGNIACAVHSRHGDRIRSIGQCHRVGESTSGNRYHGWFIAVSDDRHRPFIHRSLDVDHRGSCDTVDFALFRRSGHIQHGRSLIEGDKAADCGHSAGIVLRCDQDGVVAAC